MLGATLVLYGCGYWLLIAVVHALTGSETFTWLSSLSSSDCGSCASALCPGLGSDAGRVSSFDTVLPYGAIREGIGTV